MGLRTLLGVGTTGNYTTLPNVRVPSFLPYKLEHAGHVGFVIGADHHSLQVETLVAKLEVVLTC